MTKPPLLGLRALLIVIASALAASVATAQPVRLAGTTCTTPPAQHCPGENCPGDVVTSGGSVVEPATGRNYFLDYPCDLAPNEPVTFVLSLHGGGSYGNWQRHYFPLLDNVAKHRLVVATPFSPKRVWGAEDDAYLQNIVTSVVGQLGARNIKAFWLVGHSQGGATSRGIACTDFFKDKVDGFLSLSGGRVGGAPARAANFGPPRPANATPASPQPAGGAAAGGAAAAGGPGGALTAPAPPSCDFSHVYATGEHEIEALPATSTWAAKYSCGTRTEREVIDTEKGYVFDRGRQNPGTRSWGLLPRPGTARVFAYPKCQDDRVVADVVRIDKGHTEGLEPRITEELVRLMLSARGGKIQKSANP